MIKKATYSSYENGKNFKSLNGNSKIKGIDKRLEVLKKVDKLRKTMPSPTPSELKFILGS